MIQSQGNRHQLQAHKGILDRASDGIWLWHCPVQEPTSGFASRCKPAVHVRARTNGNKCRTNPRESKTLTWLAIPDTKGFPVFSKSAEAVELQRYESEDWRTGNPARSLSLAPADRFACHAQ